MQCYHGHHVTILPIHAKLYPKCQIPVRSCFMIHLFNIYPFIRLKINSSYNHSAESNTT